MEPTLQKPLGRLPALDLLRFLAALSVVLYHYTYRDYMAGDYSPVPFTVVGRATKYGYLGVELFFLISGYVVLLSAQGKTVKQFVLARITRLYPAFWAACTVTFLVERLWGRGPADAHMSVYLHAGFRQYAYNLTMLYDFIDTLSLDGVYWSLTVELTFYFLLTLLLASRMLQHIDLFLAAWLGYLLLDSFGIMARGTLLSSLLFPDYAPYFIAGMLFYLLPQERKWVWPRSILLASAYLLAVRAAAVQAQGLATFFHDTLSASIAVVIVTGFFGLFCLIGRRPSDLRRPGWLASLGALTYPLYLVHNNVGSIAFHRLGSFVNSYLLLGGLLISMLALAYCIHILVEKPLRRLLGVLAANGLRQLAAIAS